MKKSIVIMLAALSLVVGASALALEADMEISALSREDSTGTRGLLVELPGEGEEPVPVAYGMTNIKGVNVRAKPAAKADIVARLPITGTAVAILEKVEDAQNDPWCAVRIDEKDGFIRGDLLDEISVEEYEQAVAQTQAARQKVRIGKPVQPETKTSAGSNAASSGHEGYPDSTPVWTERGAFHSDLACPDVNDGSKTTLGSARQQGLAPCSLCWCYECLYGGI